MRLPRAPLLAAMLCLAACGDSSSPPQSPGVPSRADGGSTPGTGSPDGGSTPGTGSPDGGGGAGTPREPQGTARIPAYLKASPYTKLVLEVDSTRGFEPRASVESAVVDALRGVVAKPGGVTLVRDETLTPVGADHEWTFAELSQLASERFNLPREDGTIRIHVLFVDGKYQGGQVLGIAWASTYLVVFKDTIERGCRSGLGATLGDRVCVAAEQGVWTHELGHVLGLVNNGLPMTTPHEDAQHPKHASNEQCVMFWAFDTSASLDKVARQLLGGEALNLSFDEACKADLAAGR